ncbi:uncharacterized protein LOC122009559 isoform X1 [Zingiber officinale]|uniref:uncharacterized protein LOC122009559 isoform X1 n=2 Tax=Zingiber officinale TaxID=94328 RepID=UPI001C4BD69B|nr:uncharacterized protein LOC122009559 isoform X1 [Zingiber officinale]
MAAAEQPPKKRKLYEAILEHRAPPPPQKTFVSSPPPPPSQEEIIRKRRNKEEIRNLVDCYRRIKFCISQKDSRLMPELEQAYLALITASRGCTSVQRIVADLIPRYASFCPTALEAAARVSINMYNWSLAIIMRGEDMDSVAYETVKACILGLVDISCTASSEAPTSSVIQGICSAVFSNILTFFVSTFEGKDIYPVASREVEKLHEPMEFLREMKDDKEDNEPVLHRLFKLRALSLLCILFAFPKNLLAACFELFVSGGNDNTLHSGAQFFLRQVTSHLNGAENVKNNVSDGEIDPSSLCPKSARTGVDSDGNDQTKTEANNDKLEKMVFESNNCLLGKAIKKDPSLGVWIFSYCRKLSRLHGTQATKELLSILENAIGSLSKFIDGADLEENDMVYSHVSKYADISSSYVANKYPPQHNRALNVSKDILSGVPDSSSADAKKRSNDSAENATGQHVRSFCPLPHEINALPKDGSCISGGERLANLKKMDHENQFLEKTPDPRELKRSQSILGIVKDSDGSGAGAKKHHHSTDIGMTANASASGAATATFSLPEGHSGTGELTLDKFTKLLVKQVDASVPEMELINAFSRFGELAGWHFDRPNGRCYIDFRLHEAADLAKFQLHGARFGSTTIQVETISRSIGSAADSMLFSPMVPTLYGASAEKCNPHISQLHSLISSLCAKYNFNKKISHESIKQKKYSLSMKDEAPSNTLYITLSASLSTPFEDDDLRALCNLAVGNVGAVVRLTRVGLQSSCWFIEFNSVDAAVTALGNIQSCPDMFLLAEFRNTGVPVYHGESTTPRSLNALGYPPSPGEFGSAKPGNPYARSFVNKPDIGHHHMPVSPRVHVDNLGMQLQHGQAFQSNWNPTTGAEIREMSMDVSFPGPATNAIDRNWHYMKQENEPQIFGKGSIPNRPSITRSGSVIPLPLPSPLARPVYFTPSNCWDSSGRGPPLSRTPTGMMLHDNRNINTCPVPFIPSSITPLSQLPGGAMQQRLDQVVNVPPLPNIVPPPPLPSDVAPPLPSSPPPPPPSQPPSVPPPPNSPPLQQSKDFLLRTSVLSSHHQWQGNLTKSGVHYCTIYAVREDSVACKYLNTLSEPTDWPLRLDVTKRTDIQHVKSTFANTPPHKREVCRLLPSTTSDQKGIQDFTSYLRQREYAGVIKLSASKSMWTRLLFILPYSLDTCSLLAIAPQPAECLIALVLPKETNVEQP